MFLHCNPNTDKCNIYFFKFKPSNISKLDYKGKNRVSVEMLGYRKYLIINFNVKAKCKKYPTKITITRAIFVTDRYVC